MATLHAAARPVNPLKRPISQGTKVFQRRQTPDTPRLSAPQPSAPLPLRAQPSLLAEPLHGFVSLLTTNDARHTQKEVRRPPSLCIIVQMSSAQPESKRRAIYEFPPQNAINNSQPLCGWPYSQVCIYSSLWPRRKISKMAISGVLGLKKKQTASSVSRIPLVSFR